MIIQSRLRSLTLCLLAIGCTSAANPTNVSLITDEQKFSYAIGQQIGKQLQNQKLKIDAEVLKASLSDSLGGKPSKLTEEETMAALQNAQKKAMEEQMAKSNEVKKAGELFLTKNKSKPTIKSTASGLQYRVIKEGKGKMPKATDTVKVHYKGHLIDGTEFDSSFARNEPVEFPLNGVIKGWTEALQLMKEGSEWELFIPSDLAYGPSSQAKIPGGSTLIFEVTLLAIVKK